MAGGRFRPPFANGLALKTNGPKLTFLPFPIETVSLNKSLSSGARNPPVTTDCSGNGGRIFALRSKPPAQQPVLVRLSSLEPPALWRPVFDPNQYNTNGTTTIDWYVPSLDGRLIAVSLSAGGSEQGTLHFFEADTGRELSDTIPRVQFPTGGGSAAWTADGTGVLYTRYPHSGEQPEEQI